MYVEYVVSQPYMFAEYFVAKLHTNTKEFIPTHKCNVIKKLMRVWQGNKRCWKRSWLTENIGHILCISRRGGCPLSSSGGQNYSTELLSTSLTHNSARAAT